MLDEGRRLPMHQNRYVGQVVLMHHHHHHRRMQGLSAGGRRFPQPHRLCLRTWPCTIGRHMDCQVHMHHHHRHMQVLSGRRRLPHRLCLGTCTTLPVHRGLLGPRTGLLGERICYSSSLALVSQIPHSRAQRVALKTACQRRASLPWVHSTSTQHKGFPSRQTANQILLPWASQVRTRVARRMRCTQLFLHYPN